MIHLSVGANHNSEWHFPREITVSIIDLLLTRKSKEEEENKTWYVPDIVLSFYGIGMEFIVPAV